MNGGQEVVAGTGDTLDADLPEKQTVLVRHAYRLIAEKGMHGVSLQDVADAAGVSKAIIPYYFKSKDNLILATMRWVLARVAERIRESIARAPTPEDKINAMIDAIFVSPEANRTFYVTYLDLVHHAAREERFGTLSATFRSIVNGLYADLVRRGVWEGTFRVADVGEAAGVIRAIIDGMFIQWLHEADLRGTHPRYKETCKHAILHYLRATQRS